MTDYSKKIPAVLKYQGVKYSTSSFDPNDTTLKDQIVELLELADERYAEVLNGDDPEDGNPCYMLIDARAILEGAIAQISEKFFDDNGQPKEQS